MEEAAKETKPSRDILPRPVLLAIIVQEILAKALEVSLTKSWSHSLAFFVTFSALSWYLYHNESPKKMGLSLLYCALGAVSLFFVVFSW